MKKTMLFGRTNRLPDPPEGDESTNDAGTYAGPGTTTDDQEDEGAAEDDENEEEE